MFTATNLLVGLLASFFVGVSKTGLPGGALIAVPMFATIFEGRLIPGGTLPVLLAADVFAVTWYRQHTRWDLLRPLVPSVGAGFVAGIVFFVAVGSASEPLEVTIGVIVIVIVGIQLRRMVRGAPATPASTRSAALYGSTGGFTTFVANAAGPIMNTYLAGLRLSKHDLVGTSAWFYFAVNLAKIPLYLLLGRLSDGGRFFTAESLLFDLALVPAVIAGAFGGRRLFRLIPQRSFLVVVLVLSAGGAVKLIL